MQCWCKELAGGKRLAQREGGPAVPQLSLALASEGFSSLVCVTGC